MTGLEHLGQPRRPDVDTGDAIAVLAASTIAHRPGYTDDHGRVVEANVALAVHTADELGLPRMRALDWVYIVNGSANLTAAAQRVLARREGYELDFPDDEQTEQAGVAYIRRATGRWRKVTFTRAQAEKAKLLGKDNWARYTRDMLTARACTRAIGRYAPEVLAGLPAGDWTDDGEEADEGGGRPRPTVPAADAEPAIDDDDRTSIIAHVKALPDDQRTWFAEVWKHQLGCPSLLRGERLTKAHGRLARYLLDDADQAVQFAEKLAAAVADATPPDVHDDLADVEPTDWQPPRYDPDDALGRPFTDDDEPAR